MRDGSLARRGTCALHFFLPYADYSLKTAL